MKLKLSLLLASILSASSMANDLHDNDEYMLDSSLSYLSFSTIKSQYIVEPALIKTMTGSVKENGFFHVEVDLKGLSTGISIRDERLNDLFFETVKFPKIVANGHVELDKADDKPTLLNASVRVNMYGNSKTIDFPVIVHESDDYITVASVAPVIVRSSDFGIPTENLKKLADTVGGIAISDSVPLSLNLTFAK